MYVNLTVLICSILFHNKKSLRVHVPKVAAEDKRVESLILLKYFANLIAFLFCKLICWQIQGHQFLIFFIKSAKLTE